MSLNLQVKQKYKFKLTLPNDNGSQKNNKYHHTHGKSNSCRKQTSQSSIQMHSLFPKIACSYIFSQEYPFKTGTIYMFAVGRCSHFKTLHPISFQQAWQWGYENSFPSNIISKRASFPGFSQNLSLFMLVFLKFGSQLLEHSKGRGMGENFPSQTEFRQPEIKMQQLKKGHNYIIISGWGENSVWEGNLQNPCKCTNVRMHLLHASTFPSSRKKSCMKPCYQNRTQLHVCVLLLV